MINNSSAAANSVKEYYFSKKLNEINRMREAGKRVVNLGIGNPDMHPPPEVMNAMSSYVTNEEDHGYQSYRGIPELREAFAEWYHKYFKVNPDPVDEVLPLMGSKAGIIQISMAFLNTNDEVLIPDPGYPAYASTAKIVGAKPVYFSLKKENKWLPDLNKLAKKDLSRVKLMWVNYPNMPTGINANKIFYAELINFGIKHNILICNDNPYSFILNEDHLSILSSKRAFETSIELNSLSKSHNMAGWRIAVVFGKAEFINTIQKIQSNMTSGMFLPIQKSAVKALKVNGEWYKRQNKVYERRRKIVYKILDHLKCNYDRSASGMFVWAKIPDPYKSAYNLSDELLEKHGVFITPGGIFGKNGERYLRISLCNSEEILNKVITILRSNCNSQTN